MSKKWIYFLMVVALVVPLILTACGPTAEPTQPPEPTKEEAQPAPTKEEAVPAEGPYEDVDPTGAEVLWWHQHTRERQEGLNQMVDDFNNTNEWGITVVAEYAGGYPEIYDKMIAAISADDPTLLPNLTVGYANQVAKYQLSETLVDMDEFVESAKWGLTEEEIADFPQGIFEADVSPIFGDGHFRMAFPPNRSMEVMYYNMDWLNELGYDAPPTTWAEFKEMACAATDPDAGTVGYEISTDASRFASMVFSRHGTYFLEDGTFTFTNDTVKETMQFIKELYDEGCVTLIAESYGDQTDFGNYKTLFTIGSSSGLPYYDRAVKSGEQGEFVWGVAPLPYMDGGDEPVQNLYGASVAIPKTTPEQELAAWLFVKWYTSPEQNARWAKISNYFPVRKSAADSMTDYFDADPVYKSAFDLLPYSAYEAQWCPCYEEVRRAMNSAYSSILDGEDIDATLAQLEADANASLAENLPGGALPEPDLWGQVQVAGKVVVSTDANYAPQSFLNDDGELDGFDVEVAKEVAARLGVEIEFVTPDWDLITAGNWGGRWDISIGSMTPTEARAEVLWFTDPYYYTPASFAVHTDNTDIATPEDLTDKAVGLGTATTYESYLAGTLSIMGGEVMYDPPDGVNVQPYSTDAEAIEDLALGDGVRLDAVMSAQPTIQNAIDNGLPLKYVGTPAFYEPLAFALDKSRGPSEMMLDELNGILADMHEDGTLTALSEKWYGLDITTLVTPEEGPAPSGELFWTPELRQAIAAAIDREEIVDRVFEGRNTPAYHMVPVGYPYATEPFLDRYGFRDLDMAIEILTGLGYTEDSPFEFVLWYPPEHYGTTTADVMQVIKEQLEETGLMQVELQSQNWAEYVDSFVDGNLPFFILGWFPDFADPENWLSPFGSCLQSPDQGVNYCSETMDPLLAQAAASADPAEREALYKQIGDLWAEDIPTIPLFWEPEFVTYRDGVEGVMIGSTFEFNYNQLSFGEGASPASGSTDTIIVGTTDEVHSLDAQDAYAVHDWEILKNTGVTLLGYTPGTADMILGVAADWPEVSNEGKTYTFKIKEGITYADGTPLTAQDYVYAWDRLNVIEGDVSGLIQLYVESVEAPDDYTVVYNLNDAFGFFPALAATAPFVPSNPNQFPADDKVSFPEEIDGIGPYRMVSYTPGEQMVLEANPNYFGDDKPKVPNVIVRYFADPTTMSNAVETGEIDIAWRILGAVEAVRLMDIEGLTVEKIDAPALRYLVFNHTYTGE